MPKVDLVVWFGVCPVLTVAAATENQGAYEHPFQTLLLLWLPVAIWSWIARRPYDTWAKVLRWFVVVGLISLGSQGAGDPS